MLTTNNQAAFSAKDKQNQMLSHISMCPGIYLLAMGLMSLQFLYPYWAATFPLASGDMDTMMNQTYTATYHAIEFGPCTVDEKKADGKKCLAQSLHPILENELKGTTVEVKTRGDYYNGDLPSDHMNFMINEQARSAGQFFIGIGAACVYSFISKAHYAARAQSGLHLFLAVYCLLHAFVLLFQYYEMDFHFVPYLYRQNMAMGVNVIAALIFIAMGVLNIVSMAMGLKRAGELSANARAANVASSGLVLQVGSPEWKAADGGNKGKQAVSTVGVLCPAVLLCGPLFYFSWLYVGGVTFMYMTAGDTSNMFWHENATMATGHMFMFNGGFMSRTKCKTSGNENLCTCRNYENYGTPQMRCTQWDTTQTYPDCTGWFSNTQIKFDTGLKRKGLIGHDTTCPGTETNGVCSVPRVLQQEKIIMSEPQECNGPSDKIGEEHFFTHEYETPSTGLVKHVIRVHAKLGGAFIWATVISCLFSIATGASFAARSVSGFSLGLGVVGILYLVEVLALYMYPDSHYVPQYWRDGNTISLVQGLLYAGLMAGLNLAGFAVGIGKVGEVEKAAGAAPAEAAPAAEAPPQAAAEPETPKETAETA